MRRDLLSVLEKLGLTVIEAHVYLALLEHGTQAAGAITKNTGVHRRTVYDAISRLIEKGLVSYMQTNTTKQYQATHPERLLEILKEREETLTAKMKELELLYDAQPSRHETVFFRGKRGLKAVFDDQLRQSGSTDGNPTILILGATPVAVEHLKYYFPHYDRERVKRNISVRLLFDQRGVAKAYVKKIKLASAKYLAVKEPRDVVTCIYGDTVSIVSFERQFGILIREQTIADRYSDYFEILWKMGKRI